MRKIGVVMILLIAACSLTGTMLFAAGEKEAGSSESADGGGTNITIGHGTFWTGPFAHVGPPFAAAVDFTLEIINENPPLGEKVRVLHSDEGTIGEQQWVMRDVDKNKVDIILNVGYEYLTYRDWLLDYIETNNRPLMPSVHGGSISPKYGGQHEEPLFRGSPQDIDQAIAAVVRAVDLGADNVIILGAEFDSAQQQRNVAEQAAPLLGVEVLDVIDYEMEGTYRAEVTSIMSKNPDAVLLFGDSGSAGLIVKTMAEMGFSTNIIGPTDLQFPEFVAAATIDAINTHKEVSFVGFTYYESPAWDFYSGMWNGNPTYAAYNDASDSYTMQYYDLLNVTMLAIKESGSLDVADWVDAMFKVANPPGRKVYNYKEGFDAIELGEDIDYIGATGPFNYTETGVVDGSYSVSRWASATKVERIAVIEGARIQTISIQIPQ